MDEPDIIASAVLFEFERLAANRKPELRSNGAREWVPLCGIVAKLRNGQFKCLALATGMKCLSASKIPMANGCVVHDCHAEALALRAFNQFVLQECHEILLGSISSEFLAIRREDTVDDCHDWESQPFAWRDDISLHMYCSEAPCGDASMELTMAMQDDPTPWTVPTTLTETTVENIPFSKSHLDGRGYFSRLGAVRRKPGRADSLPTLSKSCSDKLALRQCTSLLCGLSSLLVAQSPGVYLKTIVVPSSQYSEIGFRRCFSDQGGRMAPVRGQRWSSGYFFSPFSVETTNLEFSFSRRALLKSSDISLPLTIASNKSIVWTCRGVNECLIGGILRGRKSVDIISASSVSRRRLWQLVCEVIVAFVEEKAMSIPQNACYIQILQAKTYHNIKGSSMLKSRRHVKQTVVDLVLRGWTPNGGDDKWSLNP